MEKTRKKPHYAWVILIASCVMLAGSGGLITQTVGVFTRPVCLDLGFEVGAFTLGQAFSAGAMILMQLFSSRFYDRFDSRKILLAAGIVFFASEFALSFGMEPWHWYAILFVQGAALSLFSMGTVSLLICRWFREKTALALGLALAMLSLGGVVFNPIVQGFLQAHGWRATYRTMALCGAAVSLPPVFLLRDYPEQKGLKPYGAETAEDAAQAEGEPDFACRYSDGKRLALVKVLFILTTLVNVGGGFNQHVTSYASIIGMERSALMASSMLAGVALSKFVIDPLLQRIGFFATETLMAVLSLMGVTSFLLTNSGVLLVTSFFCGLFSTSNHVLGPIYAREQLGSENYPRIVPVISVAPTIVTAASNTLFGYIYDATGSYLPMFWVNIGAILMTYAILWIIKALEDRDGARQSD